MRLGIFAPADPTPLIITLTACHMIATFGFLHSNMTVGAVRKI
jgi:hypothetical protein